jgi:hypothetical protein
MSEMVERVAKAMAARRALYVGIEVDEIVINDDNERVPYWTLYAEEARVAIEAMREPTFNMVRVGTQRFDNVSWGDIEECWHFMIDAALAPPEQTETRIVFP